MIAKIAVSAAIYAIDKPYDYLVPADLTLQPGMRVTVPFGRGNRVSEGVVLSLEDELPGPKVKTVLSRLDDAPVLSETMLRLAAFVRQRYFCTYFEAIRTMLPAGLWFRARDSYSVTDLPDQWQQTVSRMPGAETLIRFLLDRGGSADYTELRQCCADEAQLQKLLRYLLSKNLVESQTSLLRRAADKTELMVHLACSAAEAMEYAAKKKKTAPLQYAVLELLSCVEHAGSKDLCYLTGANNATLKRLEELGFISFTQRPVMRCPEFAPVDQPPEIILNMAQQTAFDGLSALMESAAPATALLYGVTGAGKTAVYIQLIHRALAMGKSAMVLVPEIALTPQLLKRFAEHFGPRVAVLHSGLRIPERYDQWRRVQSGEATVVLGTRSAVFAPMKNPGLLILDEEQEHTYKSENTPRYHAREVAMFRAVQENALVVLGAATPSV